VNISPLPFEEANEALVGTLMTIVDVNNIFPIQVVATLFIGRGSAVDVCLLSLSPL